MADRCVFQLDVEGIDLYGYVCTQYIRTYRRILNRRDVRYRSLPQREGVTIVLSRLGNHKLPEDTVTRTQTLVTWIANIPPGKRVGGNDDFGGEYAGFRFQPKHPGRHIRLKDWIGPEFVIETLTQDKREWTQEEENIFILDLDDERTKKYVKEKFVS